MSDKTTAFSEAAIKVPSDAVQAPKTAVPKDLIEARAQGRAEALALLLDIDPDTFCGEYIVDGGSLPSGDRSEDWDAEKLRVLLRADDSAYSLMQNAEAEYWHNVGLRDDIEQMHKRAKADQKPTAWVRFRSDGGFEGPIMDTDARMCETRRSFWTPLYAAPVAPAAALSVFPSLAEFDPEHPLLKKEAQPDERAAFEAWMRTGELDLTPNLALDGDCYDDFNTQRAWRGWQARATQQATTGDERARLDGAENFACYLIDNCEGETIKEEFIQSWLGKMLKNPRYACATTPSTVAGSAGQAPVAWRYRAFSPFAQEDGSYKQSDKWQLMHAPDQRDAHSAIQGAVVEPLYAAPTAPSLATDAGAVDQRHVGDSNFEGWYQEYATRLTGNPKQTARDAYAAGMGDTTEQRMSDAARELTADDADMVWHAEDGETFFHTIDDAVDYEVDQAWPTTGPLELKLSLGKRIPQATVRIFNITENGHEWEIIDAARAAEIERSGSAGGEA